MDTKQFLFGTLAGGILSFLVGFLVYGLALADYMAGNTMAGAFNEQPNMLWLFIAHLFLGAALTYIYMQWANISTLMAGLRGGLVVGFLVAAASVLLYYATSNLYTGGGVTVIVDIIASTLVWTGAGAGAGLGIGLGKK